MDNPIAVPILRIGDKAVAYTGSFTHLVTEPVSFKFQGNSNYEMLIEFVDDEGAARISSEPGDNVQKIRVFNLNSGLLQGTSQPTVIGERPQSQLLLHLATMRTGEGNAGIRVTFITIYEDPK